VPHRYISRDSDLAAYCRELRSVPWIAFDTEFVTEFSYFPDLCLVQVASDIGMALLDPKALSTLLPFWEMLVEGDHQTLVHAGREELRFCHRSVQAVPKHWFDIQLAAGLVGVDYPASYGRLTQAWLGVAVSKGETRTDWRKRPLTKAQLEYAINDVRHLHPIWQSLMERMGGLGRMPWMDAETSAQVSGIVQPPSGNRWRRVTGSAGLSQDALKIVKGLWEWREAMAMERDCHPKRILRDDLIVELAKRGHSQARQIEAVRGLQFRNVREWIPEIGRKIAAALDSGPLPPDERSRVKYPVSFEPLVQFLGTAVARVCHEEAVSPFLVGTAQDIRDFLASQLGLIPMHEASLTSGWRASLVGHRMERLLRGDLVLRVCDIHSETPIAFEEWRPASSLEGDISA
jgi:ribonuclease D